MRYSQLKRGKNIRRYVIGIITIALIGTAIYFASAGMIGHIIGDFIARRILADNAVNTQPAESKPASGTVEPDASSDKPSQPAQRIQSTIEMPAVTIYAVQLGAFSDAGNAKGFADKIRAQQYAGYIIQDKNIYRVIAAAYDDSEAANRMKADLKNKNIESQIYSFQVKAANITISAVSDNVLLVQRSFSDIEQWFKMLGEWSAALDKGTLKGEDVVKFMEQNIAAVQERYASLHKLAESNKGDAAFEGLDKLYGLMAQQMSTMDKTSGDIKQLALNIRYDYIEILDQYKRYRDKA